jgi:hypothetical protein
MSDSDGIVVANGTRHWLPEAERRLRLIDSDARIFVAVFRQSTGRIGFDLSEVGERLFGDIVGDAQSWYAKEARGTRFLDGSPIEYVRGLFVAGLSMPITVATAGLNASDHSSALPDLDVIAHLSGIDVDEEPDAFCAGITALASGVDRVCVHSVAQWVTTIVTLRGPTFLQGLQHQSIAAGVTFSHVADERLLPQW